jgi:hypothetical protein
LAWAKCKTLFKNEQKQKSFGRQSAWLMAEVVESLPGKCKALSSNPVMTKKKKKKRSNAIYITVVKVTFGTLFFHLKCES